MAEWKDTYSVISAETLRLAESPPMIQPVIAMGAKPDTPFNNLLGKTFQFAYQWVYKDNRRSVLSPYSEICVSKDLFSAESAPSGDEDNYVTITYQKGNTEVEKVVLLCSENNSGSWFVIDEYEKTQDDINLEILSPGQTGVYTFFNDSAREYIDLTTAVSAYHNVPIAAKNVETVKDVVVFSNCITGRDPVTVDYAVGIEYEDAQPISVTNVVSYFTFDLEYDPAVPYTDGYLTIEVPAIEAFDSISISASCDNQFADVTRLMQTKFDVGLYLLFSEAKTSLQLATLLKDLIDPQIQYLTRRVAKSDFPGGVVDLNKVPWGEWEAAPYTISIATSGGVSKLIIKLTAAYNESAPGSPIYDWQYLTPHTEAWFGKSQKGKETFKSYSYYNVGFAFYDEIGRTSGVLTCDNKRIYIPGGSERLEADRGRVANLTWQLNTPAPSWAKYMRPCISESVNLLSVFPIKTGVYSELSPITYEIDYNGRAALAIDFMGNYEYVNGDYFLSEGTPNIIKPVLGYLNVITVADAELFGNFLIIPADSSDVSLFYDKVMYVHRQRLAIEEAVYYEDTNTYTVTNGVVSSTTGTIKTGDAWLMARSFSDKDNAPSLDVVEDFVINPLYNIRAYSKGRPTVSLSDFKQSRRQVMMWGGKHFRDTNTTGVAAFNFTDYKQLDEKFGQIYGMVMVGDVLKIIQEKKETSIYVGKSVFTDAGGNVQLAQVDALFGNTNAMDTLFGSSDKKTIAVHERSLYYWDQDTGSVIRSSPNGQVELNKLGMENYFKSIRTQIADAKKLGTDTSILFGLDPEHNEVMVVFKIGSYIDAVVLDEDENRWMMFADYFATIGGVKYSPDLLITDVNEALSFLSGVMYRHERNNASNVIYNGNSRVEIVGVLNENPTIDKMYQDMEVDADGTFYVNTETPKSSTAPLGMSTYTKPEFFRRRSGKMCAPFLRNVNISSGVDNNLIYLGRKMQGRYAELSVISTTPMVPEKFEFREMTVSYLAV